MLLRDPMKSLPQPYQIFFPVGALYALWGALVWMLFAAGWFGYPGPAHAHWMIVGFLFSFALGFLMTAIPKFMGSVAASPMETFIALGLALASFPLPLLPSGAPWGHAVALAILVFIAAFGAARFTRRTHSPPNHFVFLPVGLLLGVLGAGVLFASALGLPQVEALAPAGRIFLYQGTMLCFVLGIGGKLVTALLGWSDSPLVQISRLRLKPRRSRPARVLRSPITWQAMLLVAGFALEATQAFALGRVLRALAATWIGFHSWKLHRSPRNPGRLTRGLWCSGGAMLVGIWLYALSPSMGIHGLHLMYIGGFGLMTTMVASRVTLAHGGYGLELELRSKALLWTALLMLSAALVRVCAPWSQSYFGHLAFAAGLWVLSVAVWAKVFIPRALFAESAEGGSHP